MRFKFYAFKLTGITALVFAFQVIFSGFTDLFVLNSSAFSGEVWRFLTAIFLHGGIGHLLYNGFALVLFGSMLESIIGGRKFLTVFFVTGVLSNIFSGNFYSSSLGASGAIFGIIGTLILIRPLLPVWAFGLPMPILFAGLLWGFGDIIGAYGFFVGNPIDNTGNLAHLSGMFFGFVLGALYKKKRRRKRKEKVVSEMEMRNWERWHLGR